MSNVQHLAIAAGIFFGLLTAVATFFIGRNTAPQRALYHPPEHVARLSSSPYCTICLNDILFTEGTSLECGHVFHITCIQTWNKTELTCPNCRSGV